MSDCSEHADYIILNGAYDLAIETLRLVREEFLMEGETNLARVEELLFIDAWRRTPVSNLFTKEWHDRTGRLQHIAEPHHAKPGRG